MDISIPQTTTHAPDGRRLAELTPGECWALVASRQVGHLVWHGADGPSALPVNYRVVDEVIRVRTAAYSSMARECDDAQVAFQVDQIDERSRSGWSVLLRGTAHIDYGTDPVHRDIEVWPSGARPLLLSLEPTTVEGRRILPW